MSTNELELIIAEAPPTPSNDVLPDSPTTVNHPLLPLQLEDVEEGFGLPPGLGDGRDGSPHSPGQELVLGGNSGVIIDTDR